MRPERRLWTGIDLVLFVGFWANAVRNDFAVWAVIVAVAWTIRVVVGVLARRRDAEGEDASSSRAGAG